ncbi:MAG TPA: hypothetical protein VGP93_16880, partial [Polyangiaceae bacterium]|nr:hypothetical protein [Polyangiaceae bacterium]
MRRWLTSAATLALAVACAAGSGDEQPSGANSGATGGSSGINTGSGGTNGGAPPPEQELEDTFRAPVVSGRWVWTANPDTGRVALIDTATLTITTADAELEPTYLASLASASDEESAALVINVGTDTVSVMHSTSGVIESQSLRVHHGANSLKVAPSSELALAWTNAALVTDPDPTEGFQDITIIDLAEQPSSTRLTVGYRPSRVFLAADEKTAFVVAESAVSVIDLAASGGPDVLRDVPLGADVDEAASARDVTITPTGQYALVRHENSARIDFINLDTGDRTNVVLPGPVTDLDLAPDATRAFAVVRGQLGPATGAAGADGGGAAGEGGGIGAGAAGMGAGGMVGGAGAAGATGLGGQGGGSGGTTGEGGSGGANALPENSLLIVLPLPGIFSGAQSFEQIELDQFAGSIEVDPAGKVGLL